MSRQRIAGNTDCSVVTSTSTATIAANVATCNADAGILTTPALTTAATTMEIAVVVTNSSVASGDQVRCTILNGAGAGTLITNGIPVVYTISTGSGTFTIQYGNSGANALATGAGGLKIGFEVIKALV